MDLLKTAFNKVADIYCTAPLTCNSAGMIIATGSAIGFLPHLAFPAIMILAIGALSDVALQGFLNPPELSSLRLSNEAFLSLTKDKETPEKGHDRMVKMGILKP